MTAHLRYALSAAALVFLSGVALAYPGLPSLDAGDFVTAGATYGVPHATGFPVYLESARLSLWLPIGNLAGRMAWMSALFSGVAAGCFVWVLAALVRARSAGPIAVAVSIAFLLVDTLVLHARVAEVYALNLALIGAALVALERLESTADDRWIAAVALIAGLGLANHALFRLWTPVLVVAALALRPGRPAPRTVLAPALLGVLALLAYGLLVASALRGPAHNWGDPSTVARLWEHATARGIRVAFADEMRPTAFAVRHYAGVLSTQLVAGLGFHAVLAALGAWVGLRRRRGLIGTVLALLAVEVVYATVINPMGLRDAQNGQLVAVVAAGLSGLFLAAMAERLAGAPGAGAAPEDARRTARSGVVRAAAVAVTCACFVGAAGPKYGTTGRDWSAEDIAAVHMGVAAPESVTVTASDATTAAILYADVAVDARPDAFFVGRHVLSEGRAAAYAAEHAPFLPASPDAVAAWANEGYGGGEVREAALLSAAFSAVARRPVYWEGGGNGDGLPAGVRLVHRWPLGRVASVDDPTDECSPELSSYCVSAPDVAWGRPARASSGANDYFYRSWVARQWGYRGNRAFRAAEYAEAGRWFERAVTLAPENGAWGTGVAVSLANTGRLEEALAVQLAVLARDPLSERAVRNGLAFARALDDRAALVELRRHAARLGVAEPEPGR